MKPISLLAIFPVLGSGLLTKCLFGSHEKTDEERYQENNPGYILKNNSYSTFEIDIDNYSYSFNDSVGNEEKKEIIDNYIPSEGYFYHVEESEVNTSSDMFSLYVERSFFMVGRKSYTMKFYRNGFASVNNNYYYRFDADVANRLYNKVYAVLDTHRQEEIAKENEHKKYTEEVNDFKLSDVLDAVNNEEPLKFLYLARSDDYRAAYIRDDGAMKDILANGTYEKTTRPSGNDLVDVLEYDKSINDQEGKLYCTYNMSIYEANYTVSITKSMTDSYGRHYSNVLYFKLDRTSMHALFDKAIEIYDDMKKEERKYKNIIVDFSITDVIDDIKEQDPLSFIYHEQSFNMNDKGYEITDDGTIKDLLINATYNACNDSGHHDYGVRYETITITNEEKDETGRVYLKYEFVLYRAGNIAHLNLELEDKYGKSYYAELISHEIDKETSEAIFNKAISLKEAQNNQAE